MRTCRSCAARRVWRSLEGGPDSGHELLREERLDDVAQRAGGPRGFDHVGLVVRGEVHHRRVRSAAPDAAGGFEAAHVGHGDVDDQHVRFERGLRRDQLRAVGDRADDGEFARENHGDAFQERPVIVGHEDAWALSSTTTAAGFSFSLHQHRSLRTIASTSSYEHTLTSLLHVVYGQDVPRALAKYVIADYHLRLARRVRVRNPYAD